jgi:hypothetical protein
MNVCKDCRWIEVVRAAPDFSKCRNPACAREPEFDHVTGVMERGARSCRSARGPAGPCGPDGKLWEPKEDNPADAAWIAEQQRKDRRFNIIMGCIVCGIVLFFVGVGGAIVKTEPQRRADYMAKCEATGFNTEQCQLLYRERADRDADNAAAIALGAVALGLAASRR